MDIKGSHINEITREDINESEAAEAGERMKQLQLSQNDVLKETDQNGVSRGRSGSAVDQSLVGTAGHKSCSFNLSEQKLFSEPVWTSLEGIMALWYRNKSCRILIWLWVMNIRLEKWPLLAKVGTE